MLFDIKNVFADSRINYFFNVQLFVLQMFCLKGKPQMVLTEWKGKGTAKLTVFVIMINDQHRY